MRSRKHHPPAHRIAIPILAAAAFMLCCDSLDQLPPAGVTVSGDVDLSVLGSWQHQPQPRLANDQTQLDNNKVEVLTKDGWRWVDSNEAIERYFLDVSLWTEYPPLAVTKAHASHTRSFSLDELREMLDSGARSPFRMKHVPSFANYYMAVTLLYDEASALSSVTAAPQQDGFARRRNQTTISADNGIRGTKAREVVTKGAYPDLCSLTADKGPVDGTRDAVVEVFLGGDADAVSWGTWHWVEPTTLDDPWHVDVTEEEKSTMAQIMNQLPVELQEVADREATQLEICERQVEALGGEDEAKNDALYKRACTTIHLELSLGLRCGLDCDIDPNSPNPSCHRTPKGGGVPGALADAGVDASTPAQRPAASSTPVPTGAGGGGGAGGGRGGAGGGGGGGGRGGRGGGNGGFGGRPGFVCAFEARVALQTFVPSVGEDQGLAFEPRGDGAPIALQSVGIQGGPWDEGDSREELIPLRRNAENGGQKDPLDEARTLLKQKLEDFLLDEANRRDCRTRLAERPAGYNAMPECEEAQLLGQSPLASGNYGVCPSWAPACVRQPGCDRAFCTALNCDADKAICENFPAVEGGASQSSNGWQCTNPWDGQGGVHLCRPTGDRESLTYNCAQDRTILQQSPGS